MLFPTRGQSLISILDESETASDVTGWALQMDNKASHLSTMAGMPE